MDPVLGLSRVGRVVLPPRQQSKRGSKMNILNKKLYILLSKFLIY